MRNKKFRGLKDNILYFNNDSNLKVIQVFKESIINLPELFEKIRKYIDIF